MDVGFQVLVWTIFGGAVVVGVIAGAVWSSKGGDFALGIRCERRSAPNPETEPC